MKKVVGSGQSLVVAPQTGTVESNEPGNPTDLLLVVAPLVVENEVQAVVEVFQRPGGGPTTQRGYIRFLNQMAELACDYLKSRRLRALTQQQELWKQLEQFLQAIHGTLDVQQTAFAIVNEGRRIAQCDRVSLALCRGGNCSIAAVSGLDTIDRRASEVASLARLAKAVVRAGQPFWHAADEADAPPQIDAPLQAYIDRSHAKLVAVLPLFPPVAGTPDADGARAVGFGKQPIGALILEQIKDDRPSESLRMRAEVIAQHSAAALANSLEHSRVFLLPLWKALGKLTWLFSAGTWPITLLVSLALVGGAISLAVVPADFDVAARGKLQPAVRREVFARLDGTVTTVPVAHGQVVERGTLLAELSSTDLEVELAALIGRQTTNQQQIAASQRAQLDNTNFNGARLSPAEQNRLASEIMQMRQEAENIERELALFREKQKQLIVQADERGQVITWKVQDLLLHRPVQRGQVLMTLADPDGPWELELRVPERRLRHLDAAQRISVESPGQEPLEVVFMLASHPGQEFHGRVVEIERTAEARGDEGSSVLVRVAIDKTELPQLHDQTTVTAKLRCGRTSIGYAWFCDLIETVQAKVLFWL
jgi:multidrug efflux pump subunit AcrA (membrane-fusion protein)